MAGHLKRLGQPQVECHHARDRTFLLGSTLILRESILKSWASHFSSPSINITRGLAALPCRVLSYRKGTVRLQTYMSSPGFEPRPSSKAVGVTNPYTGWATLLTCVRHLPVGAPFLHHLRNLYL
ncbi:hypothetical protein TNCV_1176081 [Trichonephila clavipes]|nr:hypothetical protein TNCV_1176081 [Trichonephila clavipes]